MSPIHRPPPHRHYRADRTERVSSHSLPFFEFMLYGARSYIAGRSPSRLVCVTRGRAVKLVELPAADLPAAFEGAALGTSNRPER